MSNCHYTNIKQLKSYSVPQDVLLPTVLFGLDITINSFLRLTHSKTHSLSESSYNELHISNAWRPKERDTMEV